MLKIYLPGFLFFFLSLYASAAEPAVKQDSILTILKMKDPNVREKKLILYLRSYFSDMPVRNLNAAKTETELLLQSYHVEDHTAINYFIETIYQMRLGHFKEAENFLIRAIKLADKNGDHYLLYACFTHLGFLQTSLGNTIECISSFRLAKKEATMLDDAYLQVLIDVNLSDIYYRNNLYSQSLFYLHQAQSLISAHHISEQRLKNVININIAEVYFRMNKIDSLKKYNQILNNTKSETYLIYTFKRRTDYYLDLLRRDYPKVINTIKALQKDSLYRFEQTDEQNLADAYYLAGRPDSATAVINHLLAGGIQNNHSEIKLHLYEVLGKIAENGNDKMKAIFNFKMALFEAKEQITQLTKVDTILSQIKIDEMQSGYIQKAENYKRERLWLIFAVIITVFTLIIGSLFYWNIKRMKYYEKLLFAAKKEELAYINSHEVRRHLSNIIGIIETIKQSENKYQEYLHAEEHLLREAGNLDTAIRNISAKLEI